MGNRSFDLCALYLIVFLCLFFLSCSSGTDDREVTEGSPYSCDLLRDDLGRDVKLEVVPRRIISLAPNATEILFAIGAGDRVVGVTKYCNYPPEVVNIKKVGGFSFFNLERLLTLKPDLVVMSSHEQQRFKDNLEKLGIPVYVCFPGNFKELFCSIKSIGKLTGFEDRALQLADTLETQLDRLKEDVSHAFKENERPGVFVEISSHPLMTAGETSFIGELITTAGGKNVGYGISREYAVINQEIVIERNPDIIVIFNSSTTRENLVKRLGWNRINAVQSGLIVDDLDEDLIFRAGPRSVMAVRELFRRFLEVRENNGQSLDKK